MVVAGIAVAEGIADDAGIGVRLVDLEELAGVLEAAEDAQAVSACDMASAEVASIEPQRIADMAEVVAAASVPCTEEAVVVDIAAAAAWTTELALVQTSDPVLAAAAVAHHRSGWDAEAA